MQNAWEKNKLSEVYVKVVVTGNRPHSLSWKRSQVIYSQSGEEEKGAMDQEEVGTGRSEVADGELGTWTKHTAMAYAPLPPSIRLAFCFQRWGWSIVATATSY